MSTTKTRTPAHTCERRTDGAGPAYFTSAEACPRCAERRMGR